MAKNENILVFCAHSDDQIFGPGGTLAKYAREGKGIYTIILTYGTAAMPWLKEEIAIRTRVNESREVNKILGGKKVYFFNLIEGKFVDSYEEQNLEENMINIIKKIRPSKIFTHSFEDPHPDHRAAYKILMSILDKIKYKGGVYLFDVWNPLTIRKSKLAKMYVDITETFNIKIKALKCFPSQWTSLAALLWSVYLRAFIHGFHIHKLFGERFFKIR